MTQPAPLELETDVLVIGAGAAGLMAAQAASERGASVVLAEKSIIGRGGATVLAQMTVAVALGEAEPDSPEVHAADTMTASRGLADPRIVDVVARGGPDAIRLLETFGTNWAKDEQGGHRQSAAPGHSRRRCVYVDQLMTGEGISAALRKVTRRDPRIERLQNVMITALVVEDSQVVGAVGVTLADLAPVHITAPAVVIASGGLTKLYARSSASTNMTGDGLLLAAEAGATLCDLELVQFFPIANLYPPLVHLDPIMWDPFRYKLGGRLLNGNHEEFMNRYAQEVAGVYTATRDVTTRAILQEVEAGRGSPHGGAYLDFRDTPIERMREAFGSAIDILLAQGIDLTKDMVEVAPMAHFLLGGIRVDESMRTDVPGLLACGEAIYGMHGANRLSGNAITEAAVTGRIAGQQAAALASTKRESRAVAAAGRREWDRLQAYWHPRAVAEDETSIGELTARARDVAWRTAGPLRTAEGLGQAARAFRALREELDPIALAPETVYPMSLQEKLELRTMLLLGEGIAAAGLQRDETRGAHVRLDCPQTHAAAMTSELTLAGDTWTLRQRPGPASG